MHVDQKVLEVVKSIPSGVEIARPYEVGLQPDMSLDETVRRFIEERAEFP